MKVNIDKFYNPEVPNLTIILDNGTVIEDNREVIKRYMVCANILSGIDTDLLMLLDGITLPKDRCKKLKSIIEELCKAHAHKLDR